MGISAAIRRDAFYLVSRGQPLFAWSHRPMMEANHGVLICPPVGYEQVHAHRALRHLADALAEAGYRVCRVDYHGTGDSAGVDEDPDRFATWQANVSDALRWMQQELGCRQLSMIGLRLGAALALAVEQDTANLVLWSPVVQGRRYVREMQALSMDAAADDLEAAGFVVTRQTAEDMARFDALKSTPRCRRILIVERDDLGEDRRLLDRCLSLGLDAQQVRQPGYADMMAEPHHAKVPWETIRSIVDWMKPHGGMNVVVRPDPVLPASANLIAGNTAITERPLRIDGRPELFGVLGEPGTVNDLPFVVLLNAGAAYRVGPNRLHVLLTRELAAHGFRTLRMDMAGLGDSVAAGDDIDTYSAGIFRDIDRTLRFVQDRLGGRKIVLMGLCSGAYFAFQTAAQFSNPALIESILINPLTYYWKKGMQIESPESKELTRFHYYSQSALQPAKWWRFLTGRTQIGWFEAVKMLAKRLSRRPPSAQDNGVSANNLIVDAEIRHPSCDDPSGALKQIERRGRRLACFFSTSDPGYSILMYHAKRTVNRMRRNGMLNLFFIEDADHTFSRRLPRIMAINRIVEYLREHY